MLSRLPAGDRDSCVMMWGSAPLVDGHPIDGDDVANDLIEVLLVCQYVFRLHRIAPSSVKTDY